MTDDVAIDETLVEMTYAWMDIEQELERGSMKGLLPTAFRVEAVEGENDFGDPHTKYVILFDAEDPDSRNAAKQVRECSNRLDKVIRDHVQVWDRRYTHMVRVAPKGAAIGGLSCGRKDAPPPKQHIDVADVPVEKPDSNVPLIKRDRYGARRLGRSRSQHVSASLTLGVFRRRLPSEGHDRRNGDTGLSRPRSGATPRAAAGPRS